MPKESRRLGEAVWASMRDEYVTGNESYAQIARRYDVGTTAVERHALNREVNGGRTWSEWRADFQESTSEKSLKKAAEKQAAEIVAVSQSQRETIKRLVDKAVPKALEALDSDDIEARDRVKLALAALQMQRRVHGLERAGAIELTGEDGEPIEVAIKIDPVADAAARTILEAALGRKSKPAGT